MGAGCSSGARTPVETLPSNSQHNRQPAKTNRESHHQFSTPQKVSAKEVVVSEKPPPSPTQSLGEKETQPQVKATLQNAIVSTAGALADKVADMICGEDPDMGISKGFIVENNVKFDLSIPTSAAEAAATVLKLVVFLIQKHITRGKMFKAMQTRVQIIEPSVLSLQQRNPNTLEAALPAIKSLCVILVDYKNFALHLSKKPEGFFSKAVTFFRATSDLDNLEHFDKLFTRALADLSVPLQADQLALLEAQRANLNGIAADLARILSKLDETKVLAIAKRVLVNEEALSFWMDCLPDKFQVLVKEFVAGLFMWLTETKGMTVTRSQVNQLALLVNLPDLDAGEGADGDTGADEYIDARECNLLFEALPFDYVEQGVEVSKAIVASYVEDKRRKEKKRLEDARKRVSIKLEAVSETSARSTAEKTFLAEVGSKTFVRFLCEAQTLDAAGCLVHRSDVQSLYITGDGALHVFGLNSVSLAEVSWSGKLYGDQTLVIDIPDDEGGSLVAAKGLFRGNVLIAQCVLESGLECTFFRLYGMLRWEGFYDWYAGRENMFFFLEERRQADGSSVVHGLSHDTVGVAIWSGEFNAEGTQARFLKQYLGAHFVTYEGALTLNPTTGLRSISGRWKIVEEHAITEDTFCLWELQPQM